MQMFLRLCIVSVCAAILAAGANAATLPFSGTWYDSGLVLMPGTGTFFPDSITAAQQTFVEITGYWDNTDQYQVFVNGNLVLTTPSISPPAPAIDYGDTFVTFTTPALAWGSGLFSAGLFSVNAGDVITLKDISPLFFDAAASETAGVSQFDAQVGLQAVSAPVPEPSGLAFVAAGLCVVLAKRRRAR